MRVREVNKKDRKQRCFIFDIAVYFNGSLHRHFSHAVPNGVHGHGHREPLVAPPPPLPRA